MTSAQNETPLKTPLRNRDAIAKRFNLWVHDTCSHEMYAADVDILVLKRSKRSMRIFEAKMPGEEISWGQARILPLLARLIQLGVDAGVLRAGGVYIVNGEPPFVDGADVMSVPGYQHIHMTAEELIALVDMQDIEVAKDK